MSEPKAQLVAPKGNFNLPGMNATGVITSTSFSGVGGVVTNLTGSPDLDVGIVTGSSFVGDGTGHAAGLTGTPELNLGITTATSFTGDATGKAAGLTGTPNLNVGLITATSFVGFVTGNVTGNLTGNVTGLGASVKSGVNLGVGVCTALELYGDGSNLTGAGSSASIAQEITATGVETIIDLSDGNLIYYTGQSNTTVGFASTAAAEQITFLRDTDPNFAYNVSYSTGGVDFDGTGDYLSLAASSDLNLDGDFTIEAWVYVDVDGWAGTRQTLLANNISWTTNHSAVSLMNSASTGEENTIILYQDTSTIADSYPVTVTPSDGWTHIAITRSGTTIKIFKNGVQAGDTATSSVTFTFGTGETWIGQISFGTPEQLEGKVSNLRIVKGTALYTGTFLPPSAALTNVNNTTLLCCQSDSSTTTAAVTPGTITANGDPTAGAQTIAVSGTNTINGTITWPDSVKWDGNSAPTLISNVRSKAFQIFHFTTADTGASYQAWEEMKSDAETFSLWTWGRSGNGRLGLDSATGDRSSPVQVGTDITWATLPIGYVKGDMEAVTAVKNDGTLWAWGRGDDGELGQNNTTDRSSPTQVGTDTTWKRTYMASQHNILATKTDGTLWGWGSNSYSGPLGLNNKDKYSSPTQIPGTWGTDEYSLGGYNYYTAAINAAGELYSWGNNTEGNLGQNNKTKYSSPVQVGTNTTWSKMQTSGSYHMGAIKTDGTLWQWGKGSGGALGQNANTQYSSPKQVGTDTTWSMISGGSQTSYAVKTDGTLWTWGDNNDGCLGHNDQTQYSSPKQLSGTTWDRVISGGFTVYATKTDGTAWAWGRNDYGKLGLNATDLSHKSSPTQISGTTWNAVNALADAAIGLKME